MLMIDKLLVRNREINSITVCIQYPIQLPTAHSYIRQTRDVRVRVTTLHLAKVTAEFGVLRKR